MTHDFSQRGGGAFGFGFRFNPVLFHQVRILRSYFFRVFLPIGILQLFVEFFPIGNDLHAFFIVDIVVDDEFVR